MASTDGWYRELGAKSITARRGASRKMPETGERCNRHEQAP